MTNKHIYLAGGCFWGTQHFFKQIDGVIETEVGFANGQTDKPTYEQVYTDTTGYAETVHVTYDPDKVSLEFLLRMFFVAIDPTSLNKQGQRELLFDLKSEKRVEIYRILQEKRVDLIKKSQEKCIFSCIIQKKAVSLQRFLE